jgi:hypothetical protein
MKDGLKLPHTHTHTHTHTTLTHTHTVVEGMQRHKFKA